MQVWIPAIADRLGLRFLEALDSPLMLLVTSYGTQVDGRDDSSMPKLRRFLGEERLQVLPSMRGFCLDDAPGSPQRRCRRVRAP